MNKKYLITFLIFIFLVGTVNFISAEKMWNFNNHTVNVSNDILSGGFVNASTDLCTTSGICLTNLNASLGLVNVSLGDYVPYIGSNQNVVLGNYNFSVGTSDLFVNANTGNVGIGTASPTQKLDIIGNGNITGYLYINDETLATQSITFDSTGTGLKLSNANGYITLTPLNTGWAHIYTDRSNFIFNKPVYSVDDIFSSYDADLLLQRAGVTKLTLGTSVATLASGLNLSVDTNSLFVDSSTNRVGIGTITPQNTLNVVGTGNITGLFTFGSLAANSLNNTYFAANSINARVIAPGSVNATHIIPSAINTTHIATGAVTNTDVAANVINTTQIIDSTILTGDIATGAVTNTDILLNSINTTQIIDGTILPADLSVNVNTSFDARYLFNTGDTATGNYTFDTNTLFIDSSTNRVGIGTASPNGRLHIQDTFGEYKLKYIGNQNIDYVRSVILLHEIYNGTLINDNYAIGTVFCSRGAAFEGGRKDSVQINTGSGYAQTSGSILSSTSGTDEKWRLRNLSYNGVRYLALEVPYQASFLARGCSFEGYHKSTSDDALIIVNYYNVTSGTALNSEINNSIVDFTNYNRQDLDVSSFSISGNVGIGTTTPTGGKLNVNGTANITGNLYSNGALVLTSYTETDPKWTANYSDYLITKTYASNDTNYNSSGLIKDWNASLDIIDWNATGYIKNWDPSSYIKNWNSTGYISNWQVAINAANTTMKNYADAIVAPKITWTNAVNGTLFTQASFNTNYTNNDAAYRNMTNTSYYLASNPSGYISSFTEADPKWTANYSDYLTIRTYAMNDTNYNSSGLIKDWNASLDIIDWNATGYIKNWNATGYIANWNSTGYIKNWDPSSYIKNWNSTGYISNWQVAINSANTTMTNYVNAVVAPKITWANAVNGTLFTQASFNSNYSTNNALWLNTTNNTYYSHSTATSDVHGLTFTAEGTGGGLDADTLDTYQAINFTKEYAATINAVSNAGWTNVAYINGDGLASAIHLSMSGTTGSVVVNIAADILVQHSQDILVRSEAGDYTIVTLNITSDTNEDFYIQAMTNSVNPVNLDTRIITYNGEAVTFAPASTGAYANSLIHVCNPNQLAISSTGGAAAGMKISGNTVWHAGNDGYGSGLDADTIDGYNSSAFLTSFTEADPKWTANYSDYLITKTYASNDTNYNSSGLIKDWNATGYIKNWNATGYIANWNSTGYIKNWDPSSYIKNWNSTGYISNWQVAINAANTTMTSYVNARDVVANLHLHNAANITAGTFAAGNFLFQNNLTVDTNTLFIDSSINNIGIGTTTPQNTLNVVGIGNFTGSVYIGTPSTESTGYLKIYGNSSGQGEPISYIELNRNTDYRSAGIKITAADDQDWFIGVPYAGGGISIGRNTTFSQYTANSKLFIGESGNVGINTTSPQNTLNVVGTANITGNLYSNGELVLTSFTEADPKWTANYSDYLITKTYASNDTNYNSSGLIKDWNATGYIKNWNATGYISNWQTAINAANTSMDNYVDTKFLPLAGGTMTGDITSNSNFVSTARNKGVVGTYDSTKTDQIWSMGAAYTNNASGYNFGGLYGMAYCHTNNAACRTGLGHQVEFVNAGAVGTAIGFAGGIWTNGGITSASGNSNFAGNVTFDTNSLFIDSSSNRIGIGTVTPQNTLNVVGTGNITGLFTFGSLAANSLNNTYFAANSINARVIAPGSVNATHIIPSAINTTHIAIGGVTNTDVAANVINTTQIIDSTILTGDIATGAVTNTDILLNSINTTQIIDGTILEGDIAQTSSLDTTEIADIYLLNSGDTATGNYTFDTNSLFIDSSSNRIGIGTASPETRLQVSSGSILTGDSGIKHYQDVAYYGTTVGTVLGTMKITLPRNWSDDMMTVKISGYQYASNMGAWEVIVSGYDYTGVSWINYKAEIRGRAPFNSVRLGYDNSVNKTVILLGTVSTSWSYPQIFVTDVILGYSPASGWGSGWTIANTTSEATITSIVTPIIDTYTDASGNVGIGTTTPTGGKLNVNGTANITGNLYSNGALVLTSYTETDPKWTANYSDYLITKTYASNDTNYNSSGLIKDWNASLDIIDWNATGYIKNWDPSSYIKNWNSTGYISNWQVAINAANTTMKNYADAIVAPKITWTNAVNGTLFTQASFNTNYTNNDAAYRNMTNTSYYLASNPSGYISSFTEADPKWTANYSDYLTIRTYAMNDTNYNSSGLIKDWNASLDIIDWNATGYIKNWNATGYIANWNSTGYIKNWDPSSYIKNWNSTGYISNWQVAINSANTTMTGYVNARDVVANLHTHNAANITAGTFGAGNFLFQNNLTVDTNSLFVDSSTNRVGIGTSTPQNTLNVVGAGNITGLFTFGSLAANSLNNTYFAANSINARVIAPGSVNATHIIPSAINTTHIATGGITNTDVAANVINTTQIIDSTILTGDIATGAVTNTDILLNSINTTQIIDGTILEGDIAQTSSLDNTEIADIYLFNSGDTATGNYTFDTNTLFIDSSINRVGIGKTNPAFPLDVNGNINIAEGSSYLYGGQQALRLANGTDTFYANTFIGLGAGNTTAAKQTAIGYYAGNANTGNYQTAIGYQAGVNNSAHSQNVLGYLAGSNNFGSAQIAIGSQAGSSNLGDDQITLGYGAGAGNTADEQIAIGTSAGGSNAGIYQIALGLSSGGSNTGNYSTSIGYQAGYGNTGNNVIALGYQAGKNNADSNAFIVKQANVNSMPLIYGNFSSGYVGIGTTSPAYLLDVNGSGGLRTISPSSTSFGAITTQADTTAYGQFLTLGSARADTYFGRAAANWAGFLTSGADLGGMFIGTYYNDPIVMGVNNAEVVEITSNNVKITGNLNVTGTISSPSVVSSDVYSTTHSSNGNVALDSLPSPGKIAFRTLSVSTANTDYTVSLPNDGYTYSYSIMWSGTYYSSVNSKAGDATSGTTTGSGQVVATVNKGGSGYMGVQITYIREA